MGGDGADDKAVHVNYFKILMVGERKRHHRMVYAVLLSKLAASAKRSGFADRIARYHPIYYRRASDAIAEFESADKDERQRLSDQFLLRTLGWARQTAYGRRQTDDLANWPILTKDLVRDHTSDFRNSRASRALGSTGGSTGIPLRVYRSWENIAAEQAFVDRLLKRAGLTFCNTRLAVLRADEVKDPADLGPPFGITTHGGRRLVLSNSHLSRDTVEWFVGALKSHKADLFWVYPSMLANLLRLMDEASLEWEVPVVLASSETLDASLAALAGARLGAHVVDYYGQGERVCSAYSVRAGEYWFCPASGRVELVPSDSAQASRTTDATYQIVATGYWNKAMPLVRYFTGDEIIVANETSEADLADIALGLRPFRGILGRSNEYIVGRQGAKIGGLNHLPREVEHVYRMQVVQESVDAVVIKVLGTAQFSSSDRDQIVQNAEKLMPPYMSVRVVCVEELETLSNGKTPFIVRRFSDP